MVHSNETVRFITKFEDFADTTIPYMFHCHLLMHEDNGMMGQFIINPNSTAVNELPKLNGLSVYPNPTNGILTLQLKDYVGSFKVEMVNILGEKILTVANQSTIDVSTFPSGIYFVQVKQGSTTQVTKFIKE